MLQERVRQKGYLQSSRGSPTAQQDIHMDMTQQHGAWSCWGAWAWVPYGIWWLPCPICWGITTGRGLWPRSVQSRQVPSSLFYLLEMLAWIFMGIKVQISAAQTDCRQIQISTSNLRLLELVEGPGTLHQAEKKQRHIFSSALAPEMGKLSWLKLLECGEKINW